MIEGEIAALNEKGFGFIKVEGESKQVFFHAKNLFDTKFDDLRVGDKVSIGSIEKGEKGKSAKDVQLIED